MSDKPALDPNAYNVQLPQFEGPLWRIVTERPARSTHEHDKAGTTALHIVAGIKSGDGFIADQIAIDETDDECVRPHLGVPGSCYPAAKKPAAGRDVVAA